MTASLSYSVEIVECGAQPTTAGTARFPATGDADLGVKTTGGLKITIIPLQVGTLLPDTSAAALAVYASQMKAMYPIDAISFTVGDTLTVTSPVDWTTMLNQVQAKRAKDAPSADTYYFGLVTPASSLRTYCQSVCTAGESYVVTKANHASLRAGVGVGYADSESALTMAHEVGHLHGRQHAPCALSGETITGIDPNYPYANGALGSWGWDSRSQTLFDPTKSTDIMGYCNNQWIATTPTLPSRPGWRRSTASPRPWSSRLPRRCRSGACCCLTPGGRAGESRLSRKSPRRANLRQLPSTTTLARS